MVEDLGAADGGGRRGFQAELRPRKAEEWKRTLLAGTKEIRGLNFASASSPHPLRISLGVNGPRLCALAQFLTSEHS